MSDTQQTPRQQKIAIRKQFRKLVGALGRIEEELLCGLDNCVQQIEHAEASENGLDWAETTFDTLKSDAQTFIDALTAAATHSLQHFEEYHIIEAIADSELANGEQFPAELLPKNFQR